MPEIVSDVRIPTPERYALRLAKHFEHRVAVQRREDGVQIDFPDAPCEVRFDAHTLHIRIQSASPATLARVREVVDRHLKQVASQERFDIEWTGDLSPADGARGDAS